MKWKLGDEGGKKGENNLQIKKNIIWNYYKVEEKNLQKKSKKNQLGISSPPCSPPQIMYEEYLFVFLFFVDIQGVPKSYLLKYQNISKTAKC